ncbi:MAG: hypothetical protein P4L90_03610 [Rhodopila sp.]|nr:hypothetical protein [Rhodopila sp.]
MPKPTDRDHRVNQAIDLARDIAPEIDVLLLTHYPDAETLDTVRPGDTDLGTAHAVNRAVALEMWEAGVDVLVQRADRAAFRRWMSDREDTPEVRRAWIDRHRLLRGSAARAVLGLAESPAHSRQGFGTAPGPIADRLLDEYGDEDGGTFDVLVQAIMAAGRTDVLDLAVRKHGEREGDEAGDELNWVLLVAAEGATIGPSGRAELVALAVALPARDPPDGEEIGRGLIESGALPESEELRLLPGWRSPDALAELSFAAVRRVLLDLIDGKPPRDLPPGDTDDLARRGFGVLLGLRIDWAIPVWEEIEAAGGLPEEADDDAAETPEDARRAALFDQWRGRVFQETQGCVPLDVVAFSQVANDIADFLAEAGEQTGGLEEIRAFVAACRDKAADDEIVCHPQVIADSLELSIYTEAGEFLDSLLVRASRLPAPAHEMPPMIGAFVRLGDRPGR